MPVSRLARLGEFAFRRRRLVLGAWVGALVAAFALAAPSAATFRPTTTRPDRSPRRPLMRSSERFPSDVAGHDRRRLADADGTPAAFLREAVDAPRPRPPRGDRRRSRPTAHVAVARHPADDAARRGTRARPASELLALGERGARRARRRGDPAGAAGRRSPREVVGLSDRRARPAARARHGRRRRAAADPGAVRARDRVRADHAARRGAADARLGVHGRRDARHRRRDRLRAADPHALPRGARPAAPARDPRGGRAPPAGPC